MNDSANNIAVAIAYNGQAFHGWQRQGDPEVATVQAAAEKALAYVADEPISLFCAGRTDAGVHSTAQIANFHCHVERPEKAWVMGANSRLPESVRILQAWNMPADFHARFSATARRYRYVIHNSLVAPAILAGGLTHHRRPLDADLMHAEAQSLLGEQDFSAFRGAACQSRTPMRNVHFVRVERRGDLVVIDIEANAFLLHMVRNIAGSLMCVGDGRKAAGWIAGLLAGRDRTKAAATAKPNGLYLVSVTYPEHFGLQGLPLGPFFLT